MVVEVRDTSYHVDRQLLYIWKTNSLEKLKKQNSDRVYIVDGRERIGKTLFTVQQMGVIEPEIFNDTKTFLSRICFTPEQFNKAARETKNGVVVFDEAFRGLSSRSALSKVNRMIIQTLMEMGQNNNIIFIVLPSIFLLDIYPAMLRSDMLFHIQQDKKNRRLRTFKIYNRADKNSIYQLGIRKGWKYSIGSKFLGRFYNKFPAGKKFEDAYLSEKLRVFMEEGKYVDKLSKTAERILNQRNTMFKLRYEQPESYDSKGKSLRNLSKWYKTQGIDIEFSTLSKIFMGEIVENPTNSSNVEG